MKISNLNNDITKIEAGNWKSFVCKDTGSIRNLKTGELIQIDRKDINDLIDVLQETKREMIRQHA